MMKLTGFLCTLLASIMLTACSDNGAVDHRAAVDRAFTDWSKGTGSPFDLLSDDMRWTIIGTTSTAGTYNRPRFDALVAPFNERIAEPLKPTEWQVVGDGNTVMVHFSAQAPLKTGELYDNEYVWVFRFEGNQVIDVRAFLDLPKFERALAGEPL